jgi:hypothetical protein
MARANLNKTEWLVTNTTAASKYIPKRPRICNNWNPPLGPHYIKFSKTASYEVNLTSQHSHLEVLLLSKFWSEMGDFLGMYFDAAVVFVTSHLLLFRLASAILWLIEIEKPRTWPWSVIILSYNSLPDSHWEKHFVQLQIFQQITKLIWMIVDWPKAQLQ